MFLIGEVVTAPLAMAAALGVAFVGVIAIAGYLARQVIRSEKVIVEPGNATSEAVQAQPVRSAA